MNERPTMSNKLQTYLILTISGGLWNIFIVKFPFLVLLFDLFISLNITWMWTKDLWFIQC